MSPRPIPRVRPRSLRGPVLSALALIAAVVAAVFATMVVTVQSLEKTSDEQRTASEMAQSTLQLERSVVDLETGVRGYMLTNDTSFLAPYDQGLARLAQQRSELAAMSPPSMRRQVDAINRDIDDYVNDYTEPIVRGRHDETVLAATKEGKARLDALRAQFASLNLAQ
jgi:two-component system, sensor histidine kinase and response regulator